VVFEADADADLCVVVLAGLDDFGAVFFERAGGFFRRTDDCDVSWDVLVGVLVEDQDEVSGVGEMLRLVHVGNRTPSGLLTLGAGDPFGLGVGEQLLAVLRRAKQIDAETF